MNHEGRRPTMRVIRLADLDCIHSEAKASAEGDHLQRTQHGVPPLPDLGGRVVEERGLGGEWASTGPGPCSRAPQAIGSTVPGALSEPEITPWPTRRKKKSSSSAKSGKPDLKPRGSGRSKFSAAGREMPRLPEGVVLTLPVRFDGTGQGYARIWLGNVLLLLCTLGLAWPWTYLRAQRYLLRHTLVADHRLDFSLPVHLLWPRLALSCALWIGMGVAAAGSPWVGMLAVAMGVAAWPLLIYLKMQQKTGAITWAGRRLSFDGPWLGIYKATLVPILLGLTALWALVMAAHGSIPKEGWVLCGLLGMLWLLHSPLGSWNYFNYRQTHIVMGPLRLLWKAPRVALWGAFGRTAAWALLAGLLVLGLGLLMLSAWLMLHRGITAKVLLTGAVLPAGLMATLVWPYLRARLMNAVWNKTGNRYLRFRSQMPVNAHVRLHAANMLRLVLSLGLYWPWAVVSVRRQCMVAIQVHSRVDPEVLLAHWPADTVADASAELASKVAESEQHLPERSTQPSYLSRLGT
jgi:uncharacterized membrane protein YjgN (DUF898 family)